MYNPQFNPYGYNTTMQPYNYTNGYYNNYQNITQPTQQAKTSTNIIYVSGVDDVRNRMQPADSDVIYTDNDKPLLYQKKVDSKGQFEVKTFKIVPYEPEKEQKKADAIDSSRFVTRGEFDALNGEIESIKARLINKRTEVNNGSGSSSTTK